MVCFGFCLAGIAGLCASSVRWWMWRPAQCQQSNHSHVVDVANRLGSRPIGKGPLRLMTRLPGNNVFKLQTAEKTFVVPGLPREWDGLSIIHVSDLHFIGTIDRPFFEEVIAEASALRADLAVFTGDLLDNMRLLDWIPATLGRLDAPLGRYFILGNHDWKLEPDRIRRAVSDSGWTDVAGRVVCLEHKGDKLAVGGDELPWMGEHPDFSAVPDETFRLLLSHSPDNLEWAREQRVQLMLSGHNHGGQVVLPIVGPVYSPSRYGVRYAGGSFWSEPTLLYVSRGVSGKHPLRINCLPEITKLVLRSGGRSSG
jgi:predicted MPP superfamily phosphohydrolase